MRHPIAALLLIVSLLLVAVAGPAMWLQRNVVSEDGFVSLAGPLGSDKEFQAKIATAAGSAAAREVTLPDPFEKLMEAFVAKAVASLQDDPGYQEAWSQSLRRSHNLTFAASAKDGSKADVIVDASPVVGLLTKSIGNSAGIQAPEPKNSVVKFAQPKVAAALPVIRTAGGAGIWLAVGAVVLLGFGLLTARKRGATLLGYGIGLGVVGVVWLFAAKFVQNKAPSMVGTDDAAISFTRDLANLATTSWQGWVNGCFVSAGIVVVLGVVALMVGRKRTT